MSKNVTIHIPHCNSDNLINMEKLNKIIKEYPKTYEWMRNMARKKWITLGAVLNQYEHLIDKMIYEEEIKTYE